MEKKSPLNVLADVSTVLSYVGTFFHEPLQAPTGIFYGSVGVAVIGTGYFASRIKVNWKKVNWKNVIRILTALEPSTPIHKSHFSTLQNDVKITFSKDCKTATFVQNRNLVGNNPLATKYYYRFAPRLGFYDFKHNIGVVVKNTKQNNSDGIDVVIDLKEPLEVGVPQIFTLSCKVNSSVFTDSESEYWCFRKYYLGTELYNLSLDFPISKAPKHAWLEMVKNDDFQNPIFIKKLNIREDGKRTYIILNHKLKNTDERLYVRWVW